MTTAIDLGRSSHRPIPSSFIWHQSKVAGLLRCPRRFKFRHVDKVPVDHTQSGYANILGSADHAGCELILHRANEGRTPTRDELLDAVHEGFAEALQRAHDNGEHTNPDTIDAAVAKLEGERLERLLALANDPRIRAIEWRGIEHPFKFTNRGLDAAGRPWRRKWKGTLDAWGVAKTFVRDFGALGRDPVDIHPGEGVLCDWKTGIATPLGFVARVLNVQLGIYAMALNREVRATWRTFIGQIQDLDRPKAPTDDEGKRIPSKLPKQPNPAFAEAVGIPLEEVATSKKRPKGIKKWLPEQPNPAFVEACSKPKGPLFREARVSFPLVLETVSQAIRQAEVGLFPASGALTDQCGRCPYQTHCTTTQEESDVSDH